MGKIDEPNWQNYEMNAYYSSFYFDGIWSERQNVEIVSCELLEHLLKPELPKDAFKSEIYDKTTNTGVM